MTPDPLVVLLVGARQACGVSVETVASRLGWSVGEVLALENGALDPHMSTLRRYATAIGGRLSVGLVEDEP